MKWRWAGSLVFLSLLLSACGEKQQGVLLPSAEDKFAETSQLVHASSSEALARQVPEWAAYLQRVQQALAADPPVLPLDAAELSDPKAQLAQRIALANPQFVAFTRDERSGTALRNEIMTVRPVLAADFNGDAGSCEQTDCYRVEMYNYFHNASALAFVDVVNNKVLGVARQNYAQPDLSQRLIDLSNAIAAASPEVRAILGEESKTRQPDKSEFKTALQDSRCERSQHLCVAPTYVFESDALWVIVDLTEGRVVGTRWTDLGSSGPPIVVTERKLENESTYHHYCEKQNSLSRQDWDLDYVITGSDGLQISHVRFKGRRVIKNAKLLDWHVSYSSKDGFGYSDAIGCPLFSAAVVIAHDGPQIEAIMQDGKEIGFALIQDFRQPPWPIPCNYRYVQRFEFYHDGRFRVAQADYGRGCGTDGTYRPVVRIDVDTGADDPVEKVAEWNGKQWVDWQEEQWRLLDKAQLTQEGYQYRITGQDGRGFYVEPSRGQFGDGGRGDHAFTYFSVYKPEEGEQDMMTLGSCCNTDYRQGPEVFIEPAESLQNQDVVMWYVPQLKNDGAAGSEYCWADTRIKDGIKEIKVWPCYSGPMFIPVQL